MKNFVESLILYAISKAQYPQFPANNRRFLLPVPFVMLQESMFESWLSAVLQKSRFRQLLLTSDAIHQSSGSVYTTVLKVHAPTVRRWMCRTVPVTKQCVCKKQTNQKHDLKLFTVEEDQLKKSFFEFQILQKVRTCSTLLIDETPPATLLPRGNSANKT